jgi:SAM-dependent methyltransferase
MGALRRVGRRARGLVGRARGDYRRRRSGIPADLGDLRRTTPINENWGRGRGRPLDRLYIERFLGAHSADIRGHALEVENDRYLRQFGTGVTKTDILHVHPGHPRATIVADLASAPDIPDGTFDCVVLTQVLEYVFDLPAAVRTIHRILAPGGVLLATVPGITHISGDESQVYGEWWRLTSMSARRLCADVFGEENVEVETYGNVLVAAAFLYGLGSSDLRPEEIDARDPLYEVVVAIRAVKAA